MRLPSLLGGAVLALAGCGHTSEASRHAIYAKVDDFNGKSEARAFAQALATARAIALDVPEESLVVRDREACERRSEITVPRSGGGAIVVACAAILDAARTGGAVDAKTDAGAPVLVVPSRPLGTSNVARLARGPGGALIELLPAPRVVRVREISQAGTCDRMPHADDIPPMRSAYVVPGVHAADLKRVSVPYDAEDVRVVCDHYTY